MKNKGNSPASTGQVGQVLRPPAKSKYWKSLWGCLLKPSSEIVDQTNKNKKLDENQSEEENFKLQGPSITNGSSIGSLVDPQDAWYETITLQESPRIVYEKPKWHRDDVVSSFVCNGTFENAAISVKIISKSMSERAANEANLLSKLVNHDNIIRYLFAMVDLDNVCIITDRFGRSLKHHVTIPIGLTISSKEILQQITNAVDFLHQQKIIYLNLNPNGVHVVTLNGNTRIKLTNFDSAVELKNDRFVKVKEYEGVKGFVAPETNSKKQVSYSSDIYSLGCLFFYVLSEGDQLPEINLEPGVKGNKVAEKLKSYQTVSNFLDINSCMPLIKRMTSIYVNRRQTAEAIKKHSYFWETHQVFALILKVTKLLEDVDNKEFYQQKFELNKDQVFEASWKDQIGEEVFNEIAAKCQGNRKYDYTSLCQLVKAIRNQFAHRCPPKLEGIMGPGDDELKAFWLGKFPKLIPHLSHVLESLS